MAPVPAKQIFIPPPRGLDRLEGRDRQDESYGGFPSCPSCPSCPVYSSSNVFGLSTAIVRTSSTLKPASSSRCANIANPSATGGLIVCPRSVEITVRDTPDFRMLAKAVSHGALFV